MFCEQSTIIIEIFYIHTFFALFRQVLFYHSVINLPTFHQKSVQAGRSIVVAVPRLVNAALQQSCSLSLVSPEFSFADHLQMGGDAGCLLVQQIQQNENGKHNFWALLMRWCHPSTSLFVLTAIRCTVHVVGVQIVPLIQVISMQLVSSRTLSLVTFFFSTSNVTGIYSSARNVDTIPLVAVC